MPKVIKARQTENEISDYIYNAMNTHDCSAIPTARQFADGWAAAIMVMADRFGIDCTVDRYDTCSKLAKHFGVSHYTMAKALAASKVPGKQVAGTCKVTYPRSAARAALDAAGHLAT